MGERRKMRRAMREREERKAKGEKFTQLAHTIRHISFICVEILLVGVK